jgi:HAD superfamily hydrolase (TIGR01509 family)
MKKIKGIVFDFNGTLFFDSELHIKAFKQIFPELGAPEPTREYVISSILGRSNATIYRENIKSDASDEETAEFAIRKEALYFDLCLENKERFKLVDGAAELLDYLKTKNIPFTIATGSDKMSVDFFFEHLELSKWFDIDKIVYTDGTFKGKPAPDCYMLAAERLGIKSTECLIFEDGTSGIMSANAANAASVVAIYEETLPDPLCEGALADLVVHSFKDWKNILSRYEIVR